MDPRSRLETSSVEGSHRRRLRHDCMRLLRPLKASTRPGFPILHTFRQRPENTSRLEEDELCLMSRDTTRRLSRPFSLLSLILPLSYASPFLLLCVLIITVFSSIPLRPLTPPFLLLMIKAAHLLLISRCTCCIVYGRLHLSAYLFKQHCPQKPQMGSGLHVINRTREGHCELSGGNISTSSSANLLQPFFPLLLQVASHAVQLYGLRRPALPR